MSPNLSLSNIFRQFYSEVSEMQVALPPELLEEGLRELSAGIGVVGAEAYSARLRGVSLTMAYGDEVSYPHLFRIHTFVRDMLTHELPPDSLAMAVAGMQWARRTMEHDAENSGIGLIARQLGSIAASSSSAPVEQAFARFLLFQFVRLGFIAVEHEQKGGLAGVGLGAASLDTVAENALEAFIETVATDGDEGLRVLNVAMAVGLTRMEAYVRDFQGLMAFMGEEERQRYEDRQRLEEKLLNLPRKEDLLLRNLLAKHFGEPRLSVEELQRQHPDVLGDSTRSALDKRVERLKVGIAQGELPKRSGATILDTARAFAKSDESLLAAGEKKREES